MGGQPKNLTLVNRGFNLFSPLSFGVHVSWWVFNFFGRGYRLCCQLLRPLIRDRDIVLKIADDSVFSFNTSDEYWNKLLIESYEYEPEIFTLLQSLQKGDYFFLDCGANWGYWSVLASSKRFGEQHTLAIEAGSEAYEKLAVNCTLNEERFTIKKRAVYNANDQVLKFSTDVHASARHLNENADKYEEVATTTIDKELYSLDISKPVVIKLDVEGAEIPALEGATKTLSKDTLIAYEDHGSDLECKVSKYITDNLNFSIFTFDQELGFVKLSSIDEVKNLKLNPRIGYNFFAFRENGYFGVLLDK